MECESRLGEFSSVVEEAFYASRARHGFERGKRIKSLLNFAGISVESFLNELMRKTMEGAGKSENEMVVDRPTRISEI